MILAKYIEMLNQKSIIREIAYYGETRAKEIGRENVFDFSIGNPSVAVPVQFTKVLTNLLQEKSSLALHGYGPGAGLLSTRKAIAQNLKDRFALNYEAKHIFLTAGAAGAIAHALRAITTATETVLIVAPFFPEYIPYIEATGANIKIVPPNTKTFQMNFAHFEQLLTPDVTAVLINSPNNPSGIVYATETIQKMTEILKKKQKEYGHSIFLISDEPYREIVFQNVDAPYISQYYENTLVCYSFSKSLSIPGERIGYIAVNPRSENADILVDVFVQISRETGHNGPATLMQLAVEQCLETTADLTIYETNKQILFSALKNYGFQCVEPSGTFYLFPKALEEDANAFCKKAMEFDLLLVPGDSFGCPGYFRVASCVETEKLKRSLPLFKKLADYYRKELDA